MTRRFDDLPPWPQGDYGAFGEFEARTLGRTQQFVGRILTRNWLCIPHVTHHDEVDFSELERKRSEWNGQHPAQRLTLVVVLVKLLATALVEHPEFNVSLDADGKTIIQKKYVNVGVAVEVPNGLLVPVIRSCDNKPMSTIAGELTLLVEKARGKGLAQHEMDGGSITVSSLGHIGGTGFTPIINAPEVAILGATRIQLRPAPGEHGEVLWKKMIPLSLSYDHRVINGADAARLFVTLQHLSRDLEFS